MNVSLTPELNELVEQKVKAGGYASASEVIRAGLRLLIEEDEQKRAHEEYIREQVLLGMKDFEEGRFSTYNSAAEMMADIKSEIETKISKKK